ncbi:MAG: DUF2087 domain-containing protein [Nanoarchaeota archaeon]
MAEVIFPFDTEKLFEKCVKNNQFPRNDFQKQAVLLRLVALFEDGKKYSEVEVGEIMKEFFDDTALIRRELFNFGYMQRDPRTSEYWVVKRTLSEDDLKKIASLQRHAKAYGF